MTVELKLLLPTLPFLLCVGPTPDRTISFMGTYIVLSSLILPLHPSISHGSRLLGGHESASDGMVRIWLALFGFVAPVLVMWSRVRLGVHTPAQTFVGAALGVVKACVWFTAWNGTTMVFGSASPLDAASSSSVLQNGLKDTVGVRVDSLIHQVESKVFGSIGH